jgi:tetratricopeptide (TPR) repeat protein
MIVPAKSLEPARELLKRLGMKLDLIGVRTVAELAKAALEAEPRRQEPMRYRISQLRRDFEQGWQGFRWQNVREHAERLSVAVSERNLDQRVEVLSMLGATHEHLGSPLRSIEVLEQAQAIVDSEQGQRWVPDFAAARMYQALAMTYRRLSRFGEARQAAARAVSAARRGRMRDELYKSQGCVGLVELAAGRAPAAVNALRLALSLTHEHAPESCSRSHGYVIDALGQAGDEQGAAAEFATAIEHMQRLPNDARRGTTEAWLRTSRGASLWHAGRTSEVIEVLDVPCVRKSIDRDPLPGLLARRQLGRALLLQGRMHDGQALLAGSALAYGPALESNLMFAAQLNVLCEAWALLSLGKWDRDIEGRARTALERFPEHVRCTGIERVRRRAALALERPGKPNQRAMRLLRELVTACERIA